MNGKGSGRREGANDRAYKDSPAIPESPRFRTVKKRDTCGLSENATPFGSTSPPPRPEIVSKRTQGTR